MAGIAGVRQVSIERGAVLGFDRTVDFPERLLRDRGDHLRKGDVVFGRMGLPQSIERAAEISKLVGRKFPILILRTPPETLVARFNRRDHQVADARQIFSGMR